MGYCLTVKPIHLQDSNHLFFRRGKPKENFSGVSFFVNRKLAGNIIENRSRHKWRFHHGVHPSNGIPAVCVFGCLSVCIYVQASDGLGSDRDLCSGLVVATD